MESEFPVNIKYCIQHGVDCAVFIDVKKGAEYHLYGGLSPDDDFNVCYGIFTEVPPPPTLTEEDWEQIFEMRELA